MRSPDPNELKPNVSPAGHPLHPAVNQIDAAAPQQKTVISAARPMETKKPDVTYSSANITKRRGCARSYPSKNLGFKGSRQVISLPFVYPVVIGPVTCLPIYHHLTYSVEQVTFGLFPHNKGTLLGAENTAADDRVTAQNMAGEILTDAATKSLLLITGSAALKKIAEQLPELIVLDVYMPGYSGLEVCRRLKETRETARIPVLLTVGKNAEPFKPEEARRARPMLSS